jgi:hypothetical protein
MSQPEIFEPTQNQSLAKENFQRRFEVQAHLRDKIDLSVAEMAELGGVTQEKLLFWAKGHPDFLGWYLDKDTFSSKAQALKELALSKLSQLLHLDHDDPELQPKDKASLAKIQLSAIELLFKLTGAMVPTVKEVRYADRDLQKLKTIEEVRSERRKVEKQLAAAGLGDGER